LTKLTAKSLLIKINHNP